MKTRLIESLVLCLFVMLVGCGDDGGDPAPVSVCVPFEKSCNEDVPQECNALGTQFIVGDPCGAGEFCEAGECREESLEEGGVGGESDDTDVVDSDVSEVCTLNADCDEEFADNPCVDPVCDKGVCIGEAFADGETCPGGICLEGLCEEVICAQGETVCADVAGNEGSGLYACNPLGTAYVKDADCDDGDSCNGVETCAEGACLAGEGLTCSDDNPCTSDECSALTGCVFEDISGPCDDGSACTNGDGCIGGSCVGGVPLSCDDDDLCTVDSCSPETGCVNESIPEGDPCDDGDACTLGEACLGGLCGGGVPPDCEGENPEACQVYTCDSELGCLLPVPEINGVGCNDGLLCTTVDACQAGSCLGLQNMNCDDGDQCTVDSCVEESGCLSLIEDGLECDDGDPCTGGDACYVGLCEPGSIVASNDCGLPLNGSCLIFGEAGEEKVCTLQIARKHSAVPDVTGIQFDLTFESDLVRITRMEDTVCVDETCENVDLQESPLSTGHGVGLNPSSLENWVDGGKVLISLFGEPVPVSTAYLSVGGAVVGDGQLMEVVVELQESVSEANPTFLYFNGIYAATASADSMTTFMKDGVIVVNLALE